ncbi:MAG: MBL fold metallo-hydrolase [Clostridiales bacterium]|nr:MBL fold metallo-hydrolase [Clostridiales bacterium]
MSDFRIQGYVLGSVGTNCYLVFHEKTREAVIVDPADQSERIQKKVSELDIRPTAILLTHGHFDHIMAAEDVRKTYRCPLYASEAETKLLADDRLNLSGYMGSRGLSLRADQTVRDGQTLDLIGFQWRVIATPGHTAGSVCYYIESEHVLLSGDTLFCQSLGRTDFPTGSSRQIVDSIVKRLFVLPDDTMVYSGHGEQTTIGFEKKYNPVAVYREQLFD